jgi:hypothetical protein
LMSGGDTEPFGAKNYAIKEEFLNFDFWERQDPNFSIKTISSQIRNTKKAYEEKILNFH